MYVIREDRCEIAERESLLPPYNLAQIAAVLRKKNHEVNLIDANCLDFNMNDIKKIIDKKEYDICVFRFTPTTLNEDMSVANLVKQIDKSTLVIGVCWTLKSFALSVIKKTNNLDIYIIDEPLLTIPAIIDALEQKKPLKDVKGIVFKNGKEIIKTDRQSDEFDYDKVPMPAYDLLPSLNNYYVRTKHGSPYTIIQTSKGCPFGCIYCTVSRTKWNPRSADTVFNEIKYLKEVHGIRTISFFDETFTFDRKRVIDICERIIDNNLSIRWYCNTRSNIVDLELFKIMKLAGCRGVSFGIESGSQKILNNAKKGTTVEQNEKAIANAKTAGIKTYCSFMFGLPGENKQTVQQTIEFVKRTLPNGAQFNVVVPYPGTKLFDLAVKKGWITSEIDWTKLYQHISAMRTDEMSTEELENARKIAYKSLYFNPNWILMNTGWVFRNPADLILATKFYFKSMKNYILYGMEHAH